MLVYAFKSYETDILYENVKGPARLQVECCKVYKEDYIKSLAITEELIKQSDYPRLLEFVANKIERNIYNCMMMSDIIRLHN